MGLVKKVLKTPLTSVLFRFLAVMAQKETGSPPPSVLVLAPHPDDESLGCGAMIARTRAQGGIVHLLVITDGGASTSSTKLSRSALSALRHKELLQAAQILDVSEDHVSFLSYPDMDALHHIPSIARDLFACIEKTKPALILAPYARDFHPDHQAVAAALELLIKDNKIPCPVWDYPMWFWPRGAFLYALSLQRLRAGRVVDALPFLKQKEQAIHAHRSQFENITGEATWECLDPEILKRQLQPYELYFVRKE